MVREEKKWRVFTEGIPEVRARRLNLTINSGVTDWTWEGNPIVEKAKCEKICGKQAVLKLFAVAALFHEQPICRLAERET